MEFGEKPPASQPGNGLDLTLSEGGASLDVGVLKDGKPSAGTSVRVRVIGANWNDKWAKSAHMPPEIGDYFHPTLVTDGEGHAHFKHLMPGLCDVLAIEPMGPNNSSKIENIRPHAFARDIPIRNGEAQTFLMPIFQQDGSMSLVVHKNDGQPLTGMTLFERSPIEGPGGWRVGSELDNQGVARQKFLTRSRSSGFAKEEFNSPGLWNVEYQYQHSGYPIKTPPSERVKGLLAISAANQGTIRPVFTIQHEFPPAVVVQVKDINGQPMRAVATVSLYEGAAPVALGTTDEKGFVRLEGIPANPANPWSWQVNAYPIGVDDNFLKLAEDGDGALRGKCFFPAQKQQLDINQAPHLVLQQVKAGYVRGKINPAPGTKLDPYQVYVQNLPSDRLAGGEYLIGPLEAGKRILDLSYYDRVKWIRAGAQEVTVVGGDAIHVDLTAKLGSTISELPISSNEQVQLRGQVFLSDGKTPAYGAVVDYVLPHSPEASVAGVTDIQGIIHSQSPCTWKNKTKEPPGGTDEPVVVAFLPGACGAVIATPAQKDKDLSLVLPRPLSLHGKVTIGGDDAMKQIGMIRVYAAYEGKGGLNELLSINTTAQADGTYELAGLTPGTYHIQAALDNIWLSSSQTLVVKDQQPARMDLVIGKPGAPVRVKVTDERGTVLAGKAVTLQRPSGPLAQKLWPRTVDTDGAGIAWIPTLEAGRHTVLVDDVKTQFEVPPLPTPDAVDVTVVVKGEK